MKRILQAGLISAAALACGLLVFAQPRPPSSDPVLQAMRDEMARSRGLTISGVEAPYFIQYTLDDADDFTVSASLGGIVRRQRTHERVPDIDVRVGDYKFDNTNFMGFGAPRMAGGFPVEDSYPVIRRYFWLQTDMAYKAAVEALSRKRAALRGVTQNDDGTADFAHAEPVRRIGQFTPLAIDENAWTNRIRSLSGLFSQFPEVIYSTVDLDASNGGYSGQQRGNRGQRAGEYHLRPRAGARPGRRRHEHTGRRHFPFHRREPDAQ